LHKTPLQKSNLRKQTNKQTEDSLKDKCTWSFPSKQQNNCHNI